MTITEDLIHKIIGGHIRATDNLPGVYYVMSQTGMPYKTAQAAITDYAKDYAAQVDKGVWQVTDYGVKIAQELDAETTRVFSA